MSLVGTGLWELLKVFQIYGANTNVGKTIVSSVLCQALGKSNQVLYIKPVSTGDLNDADDKHLSRFNRSIQTKCLYQYDDPVSPHLAASSGKFKPPSDNEIVTSLFDTFQKYSKESNNGWILTETAGGVLSPSPSKTSQADLFRPLRLPVILVADSKLGGISSTISSYESLTIRGYDVEALVSFEEDYYQNYKYFEEYFDGKVGHVASIRSPPEINGDAEKDFQNMESYYKEVSNSSSISSLIKYLANSHQSRVEGLKTMASRADKTIWFPFSQHKNIPEESITTIDSAHGDFFHTLVKQRKSNDTPLLQPSFDGSASWWTQGLGHGNEKLALSAAYAAGRYGHVILASTIHDPAISLAESILSKVGNSRVNRVFYSDNGSTGIEVAIKMALKSACDRYGWDISEKNIGVLGLKRSYHGDTIGSMDCTEPSVYNEKISWYKDRGYWFEYPNVILKDGRWYVNVPEPLKDILGESKVFDSINEIYDINKRDSSKYKRYIKSTIESLLSKGHKFGAVMFEPVLLGAGGMVAVDPLFQNALVEVVRENPLLFGKNEDIDANGWSGLPVIFDEVFTGFYRLGRINAGSFVGVEPDISVHAKLLTGGLVPLSVTLASESIFETFLSTEKSDALLHGHSYTAHPVGCNVAKESLKTLSKLDEHGSWNKYKQDWEAVESASIGLWSMWSKHFIYELSKNSLVEGVFSLGSVLAITLKDSTVTGYTSNATAGIQAHLASSPNHWNVHTRGLGNVLYIMASQTSKEETIELLESRILEFFI